jgi:hypothetical protein
LNFWSCVPLLVFSAVSILTLAKARGKS